MKKLIALILGIICAFAIAFTACTEKDNLPDNGGITNSGTTGGDDKTDDGNGGTTGGDDKTDDGNGGTTGGDDKTDDGNGGTTGGDDKTDDNINRFPDFTVETYESAYKEGTFSLADYRGKVVVINFWYKSCGICADEMPHLEKINNNFGDDVVVLALHIDNGEQRIAQNFINSKSWSNYNMIFGKDLTGSEIFKKCGGKAQCPFTAVLDKDGVLCWSIDGNFMSFNMETHEYTDNLTPAIQAALNK